MLKLENFEKEYMIKVKGGKYNPSFVDEEKVVFDIEVYKYRTTQKMWLKVIESNPSKFKDNDKPVENISWWEVMEYCNRLSERYKLEPVYVITYEDSNKISLKIN